MEMLTDTDEDGEYVIPRIIYSDAYSSEMVAYADLILPDTTYLERHDCISLLDRPICEADAAADAIRWPVVEPDRDVRGFQSVLCDLGARLGLPGFVTEDGSAKFADYADYIANHERRPGVGPLAGWRGGDGEPHGRGAAESRTRSSAISKTAASAIAHIPEEAQFYKPWNTRLSGLGGEDRPLRQAAALPVPALVRTAAPLPAGGRRPRPPPAARASARAHQGHDGPAADLVSALRGRPCRPVEYPIHALTQRPMAMYHSWGSQNAWLRQIHGHNPLYVPTEIWQANSFADGDWARVTSPHGEITVPVAHMAALNPNTVWTWNAIGKRKGAWALDTDAPEATKGFLLNHLIHELLPPKGDGLRWSNSDPVTGQAAWFDLRVKIAESPGPAESQPVLPPIKSPVGKGAARAQPKAVT